MKENEKDHVKSDMNEPTYLKNDDYVKIAETKIVELKKKETKYYKLPTTTQVRNQYALITRVYNKMRAGQDIMASDLNSAKVRMIYDAGREKNMADFLSETGLISGINWLTKHVDDGKVNKELFTRYANYMEALVAYHYYYCK